ncbi:unnamed protein product [Pleuronectes platessa]|uniref:Uncharacterized protein n=1 Tax=Pleuronectes platessa TaxID=8262 RepID=A0A9N7VDY1_PLEPL|nr:unnamed protein product [Pleuronectes platessa]
MDGLDEGIEGREGEAAVVFLPSDLSWSRPGWMDEQVLPAYSSSLSYQPAAHNDCLEMTQPAAHARVSPKSNPLLTHRRSHIHVQVGLRLCHRRGVYDFVSESGRRALFFSGVDPFSVLSSPFFKPSNPPCPLLSHLRLLCLGRGLRSLRCVPRDADDANLL